MEKRIDIWTKIITASVLLFMIYVSIREHSSLGASGYFLALVWFGMYCLYYKVVEDYRALTKDIMAEWKKLIDNVKTITDEVKEELKKD